MWCAIYKTPKKAETYLYIEHKDKFDRVPKALIDTFAPLQFVMVVELRDGRTLAREDVNKVKHNLREQGFHVQLPPPPEASEQAET